MTMTKDEEYRDLVDKRRHCDRCPDCYELGLANPARDVRCRGFDKLSEHIGPWTAWQGSLDAAGLMIVGKDWGSVKEFIRQEGHDEAGSPSNGRLWGLLSSIGIRVNPPGQGLPPNDRLYFTNAVLCLKRAEMTRANFLRCLRNCASFLHRQIDLVAPKVVVTLGKDAYGAVIGSDDSRLTRNMTALAEADPTTERIGDHKVVVVPVFHPGVRGRLTRSEAEQIVDWKRVQRALESN
jgi:uracil-DNA glycosylase family 4